MEKLGFGLMRLPILDGDNSRIDPEQFKKMADGFIAAGGTYFDTAYFYHKGRSEEAFREAVVKRYPRDSFTVTDKMPLSLIKEAGEAEKIFREQLERCGVEYFDYYWFHNMWAANYEKAKKFHIFEFLKKMKAEGKIRHLGFSFHDTADVLDRILTEEPELEYVQLQINYLDWEDPKVQSRKCYETATAHGKPVIVMEPIKGGVLAKLPEKAEQLLKGVCPELSIASWAVRYAASLDNVMMVLSGMSNMEQLLDNTGYMQHFCPLNDRERQALEQAMQIIQDSKAVACTGCQYCVIENQCPMDISIPQYFAAYNEKVCFDSPRAMQKYGDLKAAHGSPADCIGCGQCEEHCPQHLPIRQYLQDVACCMEK